MPFPGKFPVNVVQNMVQINVSQQLKSAVGVTRDYRIHGVVDVAGVDCRVDGPVKLTRTEQSILVRGKLNIAVELDCSRCLSVFSYPLTLDSEEEYFPISDIVTGESLPLSDNSGSLIID